MESYAACVRHAFARAVFGFCNKSSRTRRMRSTHRSRQVLQARGRPPARARAAVCPRGGVAGALAGRSAGRVCSARALLRAAVTQPPRVAACVEQHSLLIITPSSVSASASVAALQRPRRPAAPRHSALARPADHCCSASCIHAWRQRAIASATPHCAEARQGAAASAQASALFRRGAHVRARVRARATHAPTRAGAPPPPATQPAPVHARACKAATRQAASLRRRSK
jgi:hypothetical protein